MTLFIDLILLENIVMNYLIILTTAIICKANIKQIRLLTSALLGAIYAIMLYILNKYIYTNQIMKMLLTVCMVYIAFNPKNIKTMFKQLVIFYLTSFCFGGAAYYLLYCVKPSLIRSVNGAFVGTYPVKIVILGAILGFFIINISFKIIKSKLSKKDIIYNVEVYYKEKRCDIKVILDTGNMLTDPITNIPVMIVETEKLENIIPQEILKNIENALIGSDLENADEDIKSRCSIIPFSSIGKSNGIIIGFRPDYIKIENQDQKKIRRKVIIGIYNNKLTKNGGYSGLIGLNLLNDYVRIGDKNEYNSNVKI